MPNDDEKEPPMDTTTGPLDRVAVEKVNTESVSEHALPLPLTSRALLSFVVVLLLLVSPLVMLLLLLRFRSAKSADHHQNDGLPSPHRIVTPPVPILQ
jgi:hypothetical protein